MEKVEGEMEEKITKRSTSRETELFPLLAEATEDEIIVADILLNLRTLMSLTESLVNFNWKCKRRRSCLDKLPPILAAPSPSLRRTETKIEEAAVVAAKKDDGAAHPTTSPDTPFTFSPSDESDEKSSKKTSKKRSREKYLDMIERQTENRDLLRREIQNVNKYYQNLMSHNAELKAILAEAKRKVEPQKEIKGGVNPEEHRVNPEQYFVYSVDPIRGESNIGIGSVNRVGPLGFDLNLPAEEDCGCGVDLSQPLDVISAVADKRARFAEARRKRRSIMKVKYGRNGV